MARWHNREAILADFTTASLRGSAVEDFTIECSSSDEDVPFAPKAHVIQTTCLPTSAKLPKKIEHKKSKTKRYSSVKEDQHCQAFSPSDSPALKQKLPGFSKERVSHLQESTGEKTCLRTMCGSEIKFGMSGTEGHLPVYTMNGFDKIKSQMGGKETEHMLPLIGSCESQNETLSHHSGASDTVFEPQSPVLGLIGTVVESPIIKTKKKKVKKSSPLFGSHKVPKRKLDLDGTAPVKRQVTKNDKSEVSFTNSAGSASIKEDEILVNSDYVPHINSDFGNCNTKTWKLNDVGVAELVSYNGKSTVGQVTKGLARISCPVTSPGACNVEQTPSDHSIDHSSDQIIQSSSCESLSNSRISDTDPKSVASRNPSLPHDEEGLCVGDHASQSIAVATEGTNSQLNCDTESGQCSFDGTYEYTISEDSESFAPQASSDLDLIGQECNTRSGFDWVKHLQTPKKLSSSENNVDGVESAKKKLLKHGQAERLRNLLMSWRSDISIWNHELSVRTLLGRRQSPSLPSKVLHYTDSTTGDVKPEPQGKISDIKTLASPSVRNLQDFLIENAASSPVSSLWPHPHPVSQKYLELKLVEVGGQLPSYAALCEAIDSNVEDFQTSPEVKVEYTEATTRKSSKKKFLVFFSLNEHNITTLQGIDVVRVYAPWQNLNLPNHDIPALFTSCFKLHFREEGPLPCAPSYKKTVLNTLTCSCQDKATTTLCCTESCMIPWKSSIQVGQTPPLGAHTGFTTIRDTPEKTLPQSGRLRAGTILEALEKCGGVSAVPVSVTIRIHRTITRRDASGSVEAWELIGQDAAGQFCVVKIPNWPLAQNLKEALCDPADSNSTCTLTHLTMTQRLTNIQDPGLFSVITSLYNAYQSSVLGDPHLQPLLQDVASRPPQTHCYVLTVSLGVTTVVHGEEQVTLPIQLPQWTLQEAQTDTSDGQRGTISIYGVYKSGFTMHVVSPTLHQKGSSTMFPTEEETRCTRKEGGSEPKTDLLISRVLLMGGATLPPWMPENGPVMLHVLLRDAVVWHGSVVVDEYSVLELQEESSTKIDVLALNQSLCPLSTLTQQESLTLVSGNIVKVDEENAFIYLTCSNCNSDRVQETKDGHADCPRCDQKSALPRKTYSLEVWLDCGPGLEQAAVKVKLYQKTIEKLLSTYCESHDEEYSATSLLGCQVGPMPCVLLQLERPRHCSIRTYNLAELPY